MKKVYIAIIMIATFSIHIYAITPGFSPGAKVAKWQTGPDVLYVWLEGEYNYYTCDSASTGSGGQLLQSFINRNLATIIHAKQNGEKIQLHLPDIDYPWDFSGVYIEQ